MMKIRKGIRLAFAGAMVNMLVLFGISGTGHGATADSRPVRSVCETGYRGMPQYDARCLTHGTRRDGRALWFRDADGVRYSKTERRSVCRDARALGGVRPAVRDWYFDVAYDAYRNHVQVLSYAATAAYQDCRTLGVRTV